MSSRARTTQWISCGRSASAALHRAASSRSNQRGRGGALAVGIDGDDLEIHALRRGAASALCVPIATCLPPGCGVRAGHVRRCTRCPAASVVAAEDQMIERAPRCDARVTRAPVRRVAARPARNRARRARRWGRRRTPARCRRPACCRQRMRDVARVEPRERRGEAARRERHVVDDAGLKLVARRGRR